MFKMMKKELKELFASPLIYILGGLFSILMGWLFFNYLVVAQQVGQGTLTDVVMRPIFGNMNFIFLFFAPLLTMHLIAEEKRQHTLELLFMSKLSDWNIILGKFFAAWICGLFLLALTLVFPISMGFSGLKEWGIVATNYWAITMALGAYLSVGIFASSISENMIVAAVLGFCFLLAMMLLALSGQVTQNELLNGILQYFSIAVHYEPASRGAIRSPDVVYYFSMIFFFLFLSTQALNYRRWWS
jgi:ABC-2 type transport system permease protein